MKKLSYRLLAVVALMLLITGCRKKKEPTVTPQAQAPAITVPAAPSQSQSTTQPSTTGPATAPAAGSSPSSTAPPAGTAVKKTKKKKRKPRTQVAKKTEATETQPATPATTAAAKAPAATPGASAAATTAPASSGAAPSSPSAASAPPPDTGTVDISAARDHTQEAHQRDLTQQLLSSTDANLQGITRPLTADERAMVDEIRNYMAQSRAAITDGDLTRASNLATKAHLLSDELVKH